MSKNNYLCLNFIIVTSLLLAGCIRKSSENIAPFNNKQAVVEEIKKDVVVVEKREPKENVQIKEKTIADALKNKKAAVALFNEVNKNGGLQEIFNYLYRWYLDEDDFRSVSHQHRDQVWLRKLPVSLDEDDYSKYIEIILPAIGVEIVLKKADYIIPELELEMTSDVYKIIKVGRHSPKMAPNKDDFLVHELDIDALYQHLFEERFLTEHHDKAIRQQLIKRLQNVIKEKSLAELGTQQFWIAPHSKVSNDIWVYWQNQKLLLHFKSGINLDLPIAWEQHGVTLKIYNIVEQTIVSFNEQPANDSFITRDHVGRILYNCLTFGQKLELN